MPDIDQALLQLIDVMNLVDLHFPPFCSRAGSDLCCLVPNMWRNESRTGICRSRRLIISRCSSTSSSRRIALLKGKEYGTDLTHCRQHTESLKFNYVFT